MPRVSVFLCGMVLLAAEPALVIEGTDKVRESVLTAGGNAVVMVQNRSAAPITTTFEIAGEGAALADKSQVEILAGKSVLVLLKGSGKPLSSDSVIKLIASYKSGKEDVKVERSMTIVADAVRLVATTVKRSVVFFPWRDSDPCLHLPLSRAPSVEARVQRIYLSGPDGGLDLAPKVHGNNISACLPESPPQQAGSYKSEIKPTLNGVELDKVSLELVAKHSAVLAVLTILAGVFSALAVQRYVGVVRVLKAIDVRARHALDAIPADSTEGLSIKQMASSARQDVARTTKHLRTGLVTKFGDDATLKQLTTIVSQIEVAVSQQPKYQLALQAVGRTSKELEDVLRRATIRPAAVVLGTAGIQSKAASYLKQRVATLDVVNTEIVSLAEVVETLRSFIAAVRTLSDAETSDPIELIAVGRAWLSLWAAQGKEDVRTILTDPALMDIVVKARAAKGSRNGDETAAESGLAGHTADILDTSAAAIRRAEASILHGDAGVAVFALLLALVTGLVTFYWDQPFGRVIDYAKLFIWAAGTKVAADIMSAFLDRLPPVMQIPVRR